MRQHRFQTTWRRSDLDRIRPLLADLASLLDPAFATSVDWGATLTGDGSNGPPDDRFGFKTTRYANGDRAVEVDAREWQGPAFVVDAECVGLREGWRLMGRAEIREETRDAACDITVFIELPDVLADAVIARCPH